MYKWKRELKLDTSDGIPVCMVCEMEVNESDEVFVIPPAETRDVSDNDFLIVCHDCMNSVCGWKDVVLIEPDDMTNI